MGSCSVKRQPGAAELQGGGRDRERREGGKKLEAKKWSLLEERRSRYSSPDSVSVLRPCFIPSHRLCSISVNLNFLFTYLQSWLLSFIWPININGTLVLCVSILLLLGTEILAFKKDLIGNGVQETLIYRLQEVWPMFVTNQKLKKKEYSCFLVCYPVSGWLAWIMVWQLREENISNLFPEATIERMTWSNKLLTTLSIFQEMLSITEQKVSWEKIVKDKTGNTMPSQTRL